MRYARAAIALLLLVGCFGVRVRDKVLVPALLATLPQIVADAGEGIATLPPAGQATAAARLEVFRQAIESGERSNITTIAVPAWPSVDAWIRAGIEARERAGILGPNTAASIGERATRYGEALRAAIGPPD